MARKVGEPLRPVDPGTRDLLAWVSTRPREYAETMEVWQTHCPRLSVWEDAIADRLVEVVRRGETSIVQLTPRGRASLPLVVRPLDQLDAVAVRVADEAEQRAAFADASRAARSGSIPLAASAASVAAMSSTVNAMWPYPVPISYASTPKLYVSSSSGCSDARDAEEVVHRLVADRQLAPLLEAECLVERDRPLRVGDPVAGVDELHSRNLPVTDES